MAPRKINPDDITVLIEQGCQFQGRLVFSGTAKIAGECKGEIISPDTLIIEKGAKVDADIQASQVHIFGEARGTIQAQEQVRISADALFYGDVTTPVSAY